MRTRGCCPDNTSLSPLRTSACPRENRITASWDPNLWVGKQDFYSDVHHIFSILNPNRPIGSYALRNEWVKPRRGNVICLYFCRNHNTPYNNHGHRMTQVPVTVLFITFYKYRLALQRPLCHVIEIVLQGLGNGGLPYLIQQAGGHA